MTDTARGTLAIRKQGTRGQAESKGHEETSKTDKRRRRGHGAATRGKPQQVSRE